jgi:hypothetical protein
MNPTNSRLGSGSDRLLIEKDNSALKIFNAIFLSILLATCATTRQVYLPAEGYTIDVNDGDKVMIVLNDGKSHSFLVTQVDEIGLQGSNGSFSYAEMQSVSVIEQKKSSMNLLWLLLAVAAVAVLAEPDDGGSGPLCLYSSTDPSRKCL